MTWNGLGEFASMGGHGLYVWGAFVMVVAAFFWEWAMLALRRRGVLEDLRERIALE